MLGNLADGDDANKEAIVAAGAIEPLVALVRDGDAKGKADAARALGILADGNDANKAAIRSAGGIEPLAALVRDGDAEGKADAARALGILGIDSSGD
jgi:vacuolar protein 8